MSFVYALCLLILQLLPIAVADECKKYFNQNLSEEDLNASLCVWDICGHEVHFGISI